MFVVIRKGKSEEGILKVCFVTHRVHFKSQEEKAECMPIQRQAMFTYIHCLINTVFYNYDELYIK